MFDRLLCALGWHGPSVFGNESHKRSERTEGFVRECGVCGAKWYGEQVYYSGCRSLGNWERVK